MRFVHLLIFSQLLALGVAAQAKLSDREQVVRYGDFGAVGDGRVDDFEALARAHAYANERGLPVRAEDGATYCIGENDRAIVIQTDTDFGTAKFVIDDRRLSEETVNVFEVTSRHEPVVLSGVAALEAGQARLAVQLPMACLVVATDDSTKQFIREGLNPNGGSSMTDSFLVDADGKVDPRTPIIWEFKQLTSLLALPMDETLLTVRGGHFTTIAHAQKSTKYVRRGIGVKRSNVRIEGVEHRLVGEGDEGPPYAGFITVIRCANVTIQGVVLSGHKTYYKIGRAGKRVAMGSYDLNLNRAVNVRLVEVTQANDILDASRWGVMGSNFCKNVVLEDCRLSRFDAHQGVAHVTIRRSHLGYMGILLTGFGEFLIEDSTVQSRNFIRLRPDYGSHWAGNVTIRNCRFLAHERGVILDVQNDGRHDFGYACQMPTRVTIDGLVIEDERVSGGGPVLFGFYRAPGRDAEEPQKFPYQLTREVELSRVTTASGRPLSLSNEPTRFREVKVVGELAR